MKACRVHIQLDPSKIIYLNGVLDSYEGLGIMRTADESAGKVIIYTTMHDEPTVKALIEAISQEGVKISVTDTDYEDYIG